MVKNRVKVSICDVTYSLVADDNEEQSHIFQAAAYVDTAIKQIIASSNGNSVDAEKVVVLAALQCASALLKSEQKIHFIDQEVIRLIKCIENDLNFFQMK